MGMFYKVGKPQLVDYGYKFPFDDLLKVSAGVNKGIGDDIKQAQPVDLGLEAYPGDTPFVEQIQTQYSNMASNTIDKINQNKLNPSAYRNDLNKLRAFTNQANIVKEHLKQVKTRYARELGNARGNGVMTKANSDELNVWKVGQTVGYDQNGNLISTNRTPEFDWVKVPDVPKELKSWIGVLPKHVNGGTEKATFNEVELPNGEKVTIREAVTIKQTDKGLEFQTANGKKLDAHQYGDMVIDADPGIHHDLILAQQYDQMMGIQPTDPNSKEFQYRNAIYNGIDTYNKTLYQHDTFKTISAQQVGGRGDGGNTRVNTSAASAYSTSYTNPNSSPMNYNNNPNSPSFVSSPLSKKISIISAGNIANSPLSQSPMTYTWQKYMSNPDHYEESVMQQLNISPDAYNALTRKDTQYNTGNVNSNEVIRGEEVLKVVGDQMMENLVRTNAFHLGDANSQLMAIDQDGNPVDINKPEYKAVGNLIYKDCASSYAHNHTNETLKLGDLKNSKNSLLKNSKSNTLSKADVLFTTGNSDEYDVTIDYNTKDANRISQHISKKIKVKQHQKLDEALIDANIPSDVITNIKSAYTTPSSLVLEVHRIPNGSKIDDKSLVTFNGKKASLQINAPLLYKGHTQPLEIMEAYSMNINRGVRTVNANNAVINGIKNKVVQIEDSNGKPLLDNNQQPIYGYEVALNTNKKFYYRFRDNDTHTKDEVSGMISNKIYTSPDPNNNGQFNMFGSPIYYNSSTHTFSDSQ